MSEGKRPALLHWKEVEGRRNDDGIQIGDDSWHSLIPWSRASGSRSFLCITE